MKKKLKKETYKVLTLKLKRYQEIKKDIFEIEEEARCTSKVEDVNSFIRSENTTSDKTGRIAIKLVDNKVYNELKDWKECIDMLMMKYSREYAKYEFLKRRYITKKLENIEIPNYCTLKDKHVIMDLELEGYSYSDRTWKYWKSEFVYQLYLLARAKNLIESDKN